ncbi:putative glycoprotein [Hubei odonate virus 8]|uniref:Putative glycoprotein n=1 Tax=Hubei odonate virus 8 TaxID=1923003 RepID=A0A1L3KPK2_9VIRU|nr:putative glycoprotein [Hubei odonate virus 8]APG79265.1 putative glycoprotein [Hubei odonate virus 8]
MYKMHLTNTFILIHFIILISYTNTSMIYVNNGQIHKDGYTTCNVSSNGMHLSFTEKLAPGLWYGYIEYNCDDTIGWLVSNMECINCGVYCIQNELIRGCGQRLIIISMGVTLGILISIIVALLLRRKIHAATGELYSWCKYRIQRKVDKNIEMTFNAIKANNKNIKMADFPKIMPMKIKYQNKLIKKREDFKSKEPDYIEVVDSKQYPTIEVVNNTQTFTIRKHNKRQAPPPPHNDKEQCENISPDHQTNKDKVVIGPIVNVPAGYVPKMAARFSKANPILLLMLFMLFNSVYSCDNTLYIGQNGKICDKSTCKDMSMYSFPLKLGNTICFQDVKDKTLSIELTSTKVVRRYDFMYYTSDFETGSNAHYRCRHAGRCSYGHCSPNEKHPIFDNYNDKGLLVKYGCDSDVLGCDTWCAYTSSCTWYRLYIRPIGMKYPVYKLTSSGWSVDVRYSYDGTTKVINFNVNNPSKNLDGIDLVHLRDVPFYITSFESETINVDKFAILLNDTMINSLASELNFPQHELVGDIQLNGDDITYNMNTVNCKSHGCKVQCSTPTPKIRKLIQSEARKGSYHKMPFKFVGSRSSFQEERTVQGSILMMAGNLDIKNLYVEPAKCEFNVLSSYACSSCNVRPYTVVQASKIRTSGIILFTTNCSFETEYLSCGKSPTILRLKSEAKVCSIFIPTTNQSLLVKYDYVYLGHLSIDTPMYVSGTLSEAVSSIITSTDFINSLSWTVGGFAIFGTFSALILRAVKIYAMERTRRETNIGSAT